MRSPVNWTIILLLDLIIITSAILIQVYNARDYANELNHRIMLIQKMLQNGTDSCEGVTK
jgi:hypothetical protein